MGIRNKLRLLIIRLKLFASLVPSLHIDYYVTTKTFLTTGGFRLG